ncbi:MAG: LCP family protein [Dactylosporangium sp.]|nr:LCP family protein [Dactylosporangium sp.]NNJ60659.1 LCP family protein [Dactylosporangium sp.]
MSVSEPDTYPLDLLISETPAETPPPGRARHRKRRGRRRIAVGVLLGMLAILTATAIGLYLMARALPGNIDRIDGAFAGLDEQQRPSKPATAADSLTFLLVGTDSRAPQQTTGEDAEDPVFKPGAQRSDVMMLARLPADRDRATVISIPRDSWVPIPGRGTMKLNAAYSLGGPPLLVQTVEQLTDIRIDHFAIVDFAGFQSIIDTLGGVDITMGKATTVDDKRFAAGVNHLNGTQALAYVRERHSLPRGDLDRVQRQQNLLRAIMTSARNMNPAQNPVKLYHLLDAGTRAISVDDQLTDDKMRGLATGLAGLGGGGVSFLTAPVRGTGREGTQSVVYLHEERCATLWTAIRTDQLAEYTANNRKDQLPSAPK